MFFFSIVLLYKRLKDISDLQILPCLFPTDLMSIILKFRGHNCRTVKSTYRSPQGRSILIDFNSCCPGRVRRLMCINILYVCAHDRMEPILLQGSRKTPLPGLYFSIQCFIIALDWLNLSYNCPKETTIFLI